MGRLFLAGVAMIAIPAMASADGANPPTAKTSAETPASAVELKSTKQKGSFAIGYNVGITLRKQIGSDTLDVSAFLQGAQQALAGQKASMSAIEQDRAFKAFVVSIQQKQMETNKKKGEEYLAANKQRKGVTTLPSGLQYLVLKEGTGKTPKATDEVEVHYEGTLIDGSVFDSSIKRGEPLTIHVNGVIPGWSEALQLMKEGAKWQVVIPSDLAYSKRGSPPRIGPNETLIFEIDLLKVK